MKKLVMLFWVSLAVLAAPLALSAFDAQPAQYKIVPEAIWAAATGGGTWTTEVVVTNMSSADTPIKVYFAHGGGFMRGPFTLNSALELYHSIRYTNILQTLDLIDPDATFSYYGRVGALWFDSEDSSRRILVTAKTVNGNYGKTFPGLNIVYANTAAVGRQMLIHSLINTSAYRTFVGFFNTNSQTTYTVQFIIVDSYNVAVGSVFTKTFVGLEYLAFNPFVEAGAGTGTHVGCWLYINPLSGGSHQYGIMGFGAIANNTSNDPAALLAQPFTITATTVVPPSLPAANPTE